MFGNVYRDNCYKAYNNLDDVCNGCPVQTVFQTGQQTVVHEQEGIDVNGDRIWSKIFATPIRDDEGEVVACLEAIVPITEYKLIEQRLVRANSRYQSLLNNMGSGVAIYKREGNDFVFVDMNTAGQDMLNVTKDQFTGKPVDEVLKL